MKRQEIHNQVFLWALCVLVATFPYSITINRITILVLVANWLVEGGFKRKWEIFKGDLTLKLMLAFYLIHAVALLYTTNLSEGTYQLEKKASYIAFALLVVTTAQLTKRQFNIILKIFVASIFIASVVCLGYAFHRNNYFETFTSPYWFYWSYYDLTEIIAVQPNYLAMFTVFAIIVVFYGIIEYSSKYTTGKRIAMYALIAYFLVFVILLSGRTPLIALVLIVGFGYFWYFYKIGRLLRGLLASGIIVVVIAALVYQVPIMRERMLQTLGIDQQTEWINQMGDGQGGLPSVRIMKWKSSWNIIKDNWLIGASPGDTQDLLQEQYKQANFTIAYDETYNPHNEYLQVWVGLGLVGLIIFLATIFVPLRKALSQLDYLYIAFIALFAICCITESLLERQLGIIFYALFNAILLQRQKDYSSVNK